MHVVSSARRREFLQTSAITAGALAMGPAWWRQALAQTPTTPGPGPYGPLGALDPVTAIRVPAGFKVRQIAAGKAIEGDTSTLEDPAVLERLAETDAV